MRFPPTPFRAAVLVAVLVASVYAGVRLVGGSGGGPDRTGAPPTRPPGADDPLNRAVLIEGGPVASPAEHEGADDPASPFWTGDEGFRRTTVESFWMQRHEVTNEEYRRFDPDHRFPAGKERHPVVNVTWEEALAYAVSVGGTLPTEPQWEFAAAGAEGRKYPWGDSEPTCEKAHYGDCEPKGTIEVMARPDGATPEGVHDLAGNVWEWVSPSWFDPSRYPINDESRRLRGGSFVAEPFFLRASNRNNDFPEGFAGPKIGFRVVWPVE